MFYLCRARQTSLESLYDKFIFKMVITRDFNFKTCFMTLNGNFVRRVLTSEKTFIPFFCMAKSSRPTVGTKIIWPSLGICRGLVPGPHGHPNPGMPKSLIYNGIVLAYITYGHLPIHFNNL